MRRPFLSLFLLVLLAIYVVDVFLLTSHKALLWAVGLKHPFRVSDFVLDEVRGGEPFRLDETHGRPVVILAFSTLSPDLGPFLEAAAGVMEKQRKRHVVFAAVNFQELDGDQLLDFLGRGDYPFPVYDGYTEAFPLHTLCAKVPKLFVLDRFQRLTAELDRPDAAALEAAVKAAADDGSQESRLPLGLVEQPSPLPDGPPAWARAGAEAESLLAAGKYDELEAKASEFRSSRARFRDGTLGLAAFYDGLAGESWRRLNVENDEGLSPYPKRVEALEAWAAARPQSATARVALAKAYVFWAWRGRGSGAVDEEPPAFRERMKKASEAAEAAKALNPRDPELWRVMLGMAMATQKEPPEFEALLEQGLAAVPDHERLLQVKASYLSPRWFGKAGDWEAFAEKAAADRGDPALYAWLVEAEADYYGDDLFKQTKVSWPKLRQGLDALDKKYPPSVHRLNRRALYACLAGDRDAAKEAFARLGLRYRSHAWGRRGRFDRCLDWTMGRRPRAEDVPDISLAALEAKLGELSKPRRRQ